MRLSGENHRSSKLTEQDVLKIRQDSQDSQRTLAHDYNVSQATISHIKLRRRWRHVA